MEFLSAFLQHAFLRNALATLFGSVAAAGGGWISYAPDLPAGATIVLFAAALFLASLTLRALKDRSVSRAS